MSSRENLYDRYARTVAEPAVARADIIGRVGGTIGGGVLGGGAMHLLSRRYHGESEDDFKQRRARRTGIGAVVGGSLGKRFGGTVGVAASTLHHQNIIRRHMEDVAGAGSRAAANAVRRAPEDVRKRVGDLARMASDKSSPNEAAMAHSRLTQLANKYGLRLRSLTKTSSMNTALLDR